MAKIVLGLKKLTPIISPGIGCSPSSLSNVSAAAMLVFFAAPAGTRLVPACFLNAPCGRLSGLGIRHRASREGEQIFPRLPAPACRSLSGSFSRHHGDLEEIVGEGDTDPLHHTLEEII